MMLLQTLALATLLVPGLPHDRVATKPPATRLPSVATPDLRPIAPGELAMLSSGEPSTSIVLDLPHRGPTVINLSKLELTTDDFTLEISEFRDGAVRSRQEAPRLPHAYAGSVQGVDGGRAYIGVGVGEGAHLVAGFIEIGEDRWWLSSGPRSAQLAGLPACIAHDAAFDGVSFEGLRCGLEEIAQPAEPPADGGVAGGPGCREFRFAIETDTEFTMNAHGGNTVAAQQYALLLLGAASQVYDREVNCRLQVRYLRLWTGADPWTQSGMSDQLGEYQGYWNVNMGSVARDLGHMLSARSLGGGVAWLSVACWNQGYGYGLSSGVGYGFPYPLIDHSHANWEPMVVCHEIGHNFGAPHTHSMNPPADGCGNNDCTLAWGGTIMSYCHLCSGGMSNIALEFHPYTIGAIESFIASVPCGDFGVKAVDDAAATLEGQPVDIAPLVNDAFVNCTQVSLDSFFATSAGGGSIAVVPGSDPAAPTLRYTPAEGYSGTDSFYYTIEDAGGATSIGTVRIVVRPIVDQSYVLGNLAALDARWYALAAEVPVVPDFRTLVPSGTSTLPDVNIASTGGNFSTSGRADLVGAVIEGWINIPTTGDWTFFTESDDGSKLFIANALVVNNDGVHGMVERAGQIGLERGLHRFRFEFFENFGGAGAIARWQGPGVSKAVVPASVLSRGGIPMQLDLDLDGTVAASDLAVLLSSWGPTGGAPVLADFDKSGFVDAGDLSRLLGAWGT